MAVGADGGASIGPGVRDDHPKDECGVFGV
jgi:hypothetical protein